MVVKSILKANCSGRLRLRQSLLVLFVLLFLKFQVCYAASTPEPCASITLHLGPHERVGFSYWDELFFYKMLMFSNPSQLDTTITRKTPLTKPLLLSWNFILPSNKMIRYSFIVRPQDDIQIGMSFPYLFPKSDFVFVVDSSDSFYTTNFFPGTFRKSLNAVEKEKLNKQFLLSIDKAYNNILEKIDVDFNSGLYDSSVLKQKKWSAMSHYYATIYRIAVDVCPDSKILKDKLHADQKKIDILINQTPALSGNLITILEKRREMVLGINGVEADGFWRVYYDIFNDNNDPYKVPLLLIRLRTPLRQNDKEFSEAIRAFNKLYPDKKFLTDSILLIKTPIINSENSDLFLTIDGGKHSWKDIMDTDKIVIVDVWASWCAPCRALFPAFDSVKTILNKESYRFVSLNIDEAKSDWEIVSKGEKHFLKDNNFHLTNAKQSYFVKTFRLESIPRIIVLKNGKVLSADFYRPTEKLFVKQLRIYNIEILK